MSFSIRKFSTLFMFKCKEIIKNKGTLMGIAMALILPLAIKFLYSSLAEGKEIPSMLLGTILNIGVLTVITSIALSVPAGGVAKEKEKHTLRNLMTSSVSGLEFFLASILPPIIVSVLLNIAIVFISGLSLKVVNLPVFILISTIACLTSAVLGMLIGIFAKDQMGVSTLLMPALLLLMLLPMFGSMMPGLEKISGFVYTGVVSQMISAYSQDMSFSLNIVNLLVLVGQMIVIGGLFLYFYQKNGFDND